MLCLLFTSHSRTDSSWEPERRTLPSVDTDRHVTWFLCPLKTFPVFCSGRKLCSLCPGCGVGRGQLSVSGMWGTHRVLPQPPVATHPAAQVHLEDGAIAASTEHMMLSQVHGHRRDAHVKQDRQKQISRGDGPELQGWEAWHHGQPGTQPSQGASKAEDPGTTLPMLQASEPITDAQATLAGGAAAQLLHQTGKLSHQGWVRRPCLPSLCS